MNTLWTALQSAATRFADRGITLASGRTQTSRRTFVQVVAAAKDAAARLAALGVESGDRVLVSLPTSWAWLDAWLGALALGARPVAVPLPRPFAPARLRARMLEQLTLELRPACIVSEEEAPQRPGTDERPISRTITPLTLARTSPVRAPHVERTEESPAFLQLTSGTTGTPRAVIVSNAAVLHNIAAIDAAMARGQTGRCASIVSWLPLHHDMGLVGALLLAIVTGRNLHLLPPKLFVASPSLWLDAIARQQDVLTFAPPFAYQLCLEAPARRTHVPRLDAWRMAISGAEMLRADLLTRFARTFDLRPDTLRPAYGLAEATLGVTLDQREEGIRTRPAPRATARQFGLSEVVCVGAPLPGMEIRIADAADWPLRDDVIGEVEVRSASICSGYYGDAGGTADALRDGWLHTGDLGFMNGGELYVTGRRKDIMILRGENLMPHTLEAIAEAASDAPAGCRAAAFSIARDARGEQAIVAVETRVSSPDALAALERAIRADIGLQMSLQLADVVFVPRGALPRSSSGKLQRGVVRDVYLDGRLPRIGSVPRNSRVDA